VIGSGILGRLFGSGVLSSSLEGSEVVRTEPATRRMLLLMLAGLAGGLTRVARADPAAGPVAPIQQLVDALLRSMKAAAGTPFSVRFERLAPVIDRVFDLDAILRASVGLAWSSLPPDQQTLLRPVFRRYTIVSYVNNFDHYNGQRFTVSPATRPAGNGGQIVSTRITPTSGDSHELDYVMRKTPTGWRAVDVLADGTISRVAVQRSDFRRLIARGGAAALAQSLSSKSLDLSDGMS
jgi:phospholipid transport system substrate-binding protein